MTSSRLRHPVLTRAIVFNKQAQAKLCHNWFAFDSAVRGALAPATWVT